ncbi:MAG: hypothetical protein ACOY0T_25350 [Myxococcota bacterium]
MLGRFGNVALLVALGSSTGCAFASGSVTRIADGVEREGRAVSAEAYAYYARGVVLEGRGDARAALAAYRAALKEDPDSAELHARAGSAECSQSQSSGDEHARAAEESFARARELDAYSSNAWALAARCAAHRARPHEALDAARKAASFDADSVYFSLLVVEYAEALGDLATARAWLDGLLVRSPESREALNAAVAFAKRHDDAARRLRAEQKLAELGAPPDTNAELRAALARGDLPAARKAALALRVPPAELALRAVRLSTASVASEQAALALGADPNDADAWVAALVAADLARDRAALARLLHEDPVAPSPPSSLALELLGELLARLAGDDARAAWGAPSAATTQNSAQSATLHVSEKDH